MGSSCIGAITCHPSTRVGGGSICQSQSHVGARVRMVETLCSMLEVVPEFRISI